jgi:hypothetical protein
MFADKQLQQIGRGAAGGLGIYPAGQQPVSQPVMYDQGVLFGGGGGGGGHVLENKKGE